MLAKLLIFALLGACFVTATPILKNINKQLNDVDNYEFRQSVERFIKLEHKDSEKVKKLAALLSLLIKREKLKGSSTIEISRAYWELEIQFSEQISEEKYEQTKEDAEEDIKNLSEFFDLEIKLLKEILEALEKGSSNGEIIKQTKEKLAQVIDTLLKKVWDIIGSHNKIWEKRIEEAKKQGQEKFEEVKKEAEEALATLYNFYKDTLISLSKYIQRLVK